MIRSSGIILLFLLCGLLASGAPGGRPETAPNLCTIPLTRAVRIPVSMLAAQDTAKSSSAAPTNLMISLGAEDELPEGPDGFDVLESTITRRGETKPPFCNIVATSIHFSLRIAFG